MVTESLGICMHSPEFYGIPMLVLDTSSSGYKNIDMIYHCHEAMNMNKINGLKSSISDKELTEFLLTHPDILIIFRKNILEGFPQRDTLEIAFKSSKVKLKLINKARLPKSRLLETNFLLHDQ